MYIKIISDEIVETTDKFWNKSEGQVVMYKVWKDIGKLTFTDIPKEDRELIRKKNIKEAKKAIKKAIETNFDDYVTEIELTKEDFEDTKTEKSESTP